MEKYDIWIWNGKQNTYDLLLWKGINQIMEKNILSQLNILFWGAGKLAEKILSDTKSKRELFQDNIVGFVDNDFRKSGKKLGGVNVYTPDIAKGIKFDYIVITTKYYDEIMKQILTNWKLDEHRIFLFGEYEKFCYTRQQYYKYYCNKKIGNNKKGKVPVVYTAIIGNYDELREPLLYDKDVRYICFTNNEKLKSKVWEIVYIENEELSNVLLSRKIKLFPHKYIKGVASSIWVDAKLQITGDLQELVDNYCNSSSILCFSHFERNCIYDEAVACRLSKKVSMKDILPQIFSYYKEDYPLNAGLYETGFLYREHNEEISSLMNDWWEEILKFTHRDQISFPYVLNKKKIRPDISDLYIYKNKYLKRYDHLKP